jgi:16S rRNA (cytidine1402-2'-O)-methyltransferase
VSVTHVSGTLYIIATPIGNLEDITARAVRILGEVDLIACEDTRQTRKLLDRYGISKPLVSYHEHNEQPRSADLLRELEAGKDIALVSDAGTPLIADPGYRLVEQAREMGIPVSPIPGPSALLAALSASGLPTNSFSFHGFLPPKRGQRRKLLEDLRASDATLVFYEAPHRILDTLEDVDEILGSRPLVLARELTKIHEEFLRGTAAGLRETLGKRASVKGEITLMIGKGETAQVDETPLAEAVDKLVRSGVPKMEALKTVARQRGLPKREVYKQINER